MPKAATVLVIDNDHDVARGVARRLLATGYDVIVAGNGRDGIRLANAERPHVILLDSRMPPVCGRSILWWLRQHPASAAIPLVIFTTDSPTHNSRRRSKLGARFAMTKPYEAPHLLATVRAALSPSLLPNLRRGTETVGNKTIRPSRRIDSGEAQTQAAGRCVSTETFAGASSPLRAFLDRRRHAELQKPRISTE